MSYNKGKDDSFPTLDGYLMILSGGSNKGEHRGDPKLTTDDAEGKDGGFPTLDGCLMIFGGSAAYDSKRRHKLANREVYMAEPTTPSFLRWSESVITFDRTDHPKSVPRLGRYMLVVDPIIGTKRLTKVLMDRGSGLNITFGMKTCRHTVSQMDLLRMSPEIRLASTQG